MPQPLSTRAVEIIDNAEGPIESNQNFRRSLAIIIGINDYGNGIPRLETPVNDAEQVAAILEREQKFVIQEKLTADVSRAKLVTLFSETLPALNLDKQDRLLVYFAGHGVSMQGEDGEPQYFLIPQDAQSADASTFLPMRDVREWLLQLDCRHLLLVLDCCFAGGFGRTRALDNPPPVIYRQRYNFYVRSAAWQVIASAAHDETALDTAGGFVFGRRYTGATPNNSPFALALMDALRGEADTNPPTHPGEPNGDGLITVTEVLSFVRDRVQAQADEISHRQTPALWALLPKHQAGEYFFGNPQRALQLQDAPALTADSNPYRGLKSYEQAQSDLFFGRSKQIQQLRELVAQHSFLAVLGASGTGKSSLVKAGLVPTLANAHVMRPTDEPLSALEALLTNALPDAQVNLVQDEKALRDCVTEWREKNPEQRLILVIDQFEELVTLCDERERKQFQTLLANALHVHADGLCVILTLRTDFEPSFANGPLQEFWRAERARYIVPPMTQDDLRQVIVGPALKREVYFESSALVETLINEVIQMPGGLPLLSFALSEMYLQYLQSGRQDRTLSQQEYQAVGGVVGSLRNAANNVYAGLADNQHRSIMERVMLRMVAIEGGEVARRRVATVELDYGAQENPMRQNVVDTLTNARLVVNGGEGNTTWTEPAHDALISGWDRLMEWKLRAAPYLPLQREIAPAALRWKAADAKHKTALLWNNDPRLSQLQDTLWRTNGKTAPSKSGTPNHTPSQKTRANQRGILHPVRQLLFPRTDTPTDPQWLNQPEVVFVQASVKRRSRVFQRLIGITAVVIVALSILTLIAVLNANEANRQTQIADGQKQTAEANAIRANQAKETAIAEQGLSHSRELAALARSQFDTNPDQALLIAAEANRDPRYVTFESEDALRQLLTNYPLIRVLRGHENAVNSAQYAQDGKTIVTASDDKTARVWNAVTGKELAVLRGHEGHVRDAQYAPDGKTIVTASDDDTARVWDVVTGKELAVLHGHQDSINSAQFSPDGKTVVTAGCEKIENGFCTLGAASVWNMKTGKELVTLRGHENRVNSAQYAPNGKTIVTASGNGGLRLAGTDDFTARVWDAITGEELTVMSGHKNVVVSARFAPDSKKVVTASADGTARVWDAVTGKELVVLRGHTDSVNSAQFSPDGKTIVTASFDGTARVWDAVTGKEIAVRRGHDGYVLSAQFAPDSKTIVTAGYDKTARVWDVVTGKELTVLHGHADSVNSAQFSPDGKTVVTASDDNTARLWDGATGKELTVLFWYWQPLVSVRFSPNGKTVAITSFEGAVHVQDTMKREGPVLLINSQNGVNSAEFSPDGKMIVTASDDTTARVWDAVTGKELTVLNGHGSSVNSAEFSPDGKMIVTASDDTTAQIWDTMTGKELTVLRGHTGSVNSAQFSPRGNMIVTACDDKTARIWDAVTGKELIALHGHEGSVNSAQFSPDGKTIVTASDDKTARIWDAVTGKELTVLHGHEGSANSAQFSPDGKTIVTASDDRTARIYFIGVQDLIPLVQLRVGREFTCEERNQYLHEQNACPIPTRSPTP